LSKKNFFSRFGGTIPGDWKVGTLRRAPFGGAADPRGLWADCPGIVPSWGKRVFMEGAAAEGRRAKLKAAPRAPMYNELVWPFLTRPPLWRRLPRSRECRQQREIDPEAWATLHSDTSRPFEKPRSGRIAVKVINHLGDEVMKVFKV